MCERFVGRCLVQENKDPEAVRRRAMQDPEIQQIIADPAMQLILQQMQKDPQALREYVSCCLSVSWLLGLLCCLALVLSLEDRDFLIIVTNLCNYLSPGSVTVSR